MTKALRASTTCLILAAALAAFVLLKTKFDPKAGHFLVSLLEQRFPRAGAGDPASLTGIIALGGDFRRFETAMELARHFDNVPVLMSARGEEDAVLAYAKKIGLPGERLILEPKSRSTFENALFAAELLKPKSGQCWLLVTSASHMPRSIGVFRKMGFKVLSWPVFSSAPVTERDAAALALYEWPRLFGSWLLGWTDSLFPGPGAQGENDCALKVANR
jgi:uncharacterized SAM-binding protein YcdF (DUF218 family)